MRCPKCGANEDKVIDSRSLPSDQVIRRRRLCLVCTYRFTTHEEVLRETLRVVKRDGRLEVFSRAKLEGGLLSACQKRPVSTEAIKALVDDVVLALDHDIGLEVSTETLGTLIMVRLKALDKVAYIRFASVYRRFDDIDQFIHAIQSIDAGEVGATHV